jgi:hypothetical protein
MDIEDKTTLKNKLLSQIVKVNGLYYCPYCPKWSNSRSLILQHLSRIKPCNFEKEKEKNKNFQYLKGSFKIIFD